MKNDLELKQEVIARLGMEPKIDAASLGVAVKDGIVTLRGSMETEADRAVTERAVRVIKGVKGLVDDDLQVETGKRVQPRDAEIQAAAREAIQWLTTVSQEHVRVECRNGWVTLEGEVESGHQARCIEEVVRPLAGVHGVKNLLTEATEAQTA